MSSKTRIYLAAVAVCLSVAACGGGGSDESNDSSDAPLSSAPALVQDFASQINAVRSQPQNCGGTTMPAVTALTNWNSKLQASAQKHADDMAANNFFSHTGSDGSDFTSRADAAGYTGALIAENIAGGSGSPAAITKAWLSSTGHCMSIMNGSATLMALAQNGKYTVLVLAD